MKVSHILLSNREFLRKSPEKHAVSLHTETSQNGQSFNRRRQRFQRIYSRVIATISDWVPILIVGPHVPTPLVVYKEKSPLR